MENIKTILNGIGFMFIAFTFPFWFVLLLIGWVAIALPTAIYDGLTMKPKDVDNRTSASVRG